MKRQFIKAILVMCVAAAPLSSVYPQGTSTAVQITEFDVNGMKVLIKKRPGTPTVAAGLFFRGGVRNLTPENAGIEAFTLNAAAEGSKNYPRQKLRKETSSVGTLISSGSNYDFSALALTCTKLSFDDSWKIFVDVALNPTFAPQDVERVRQNFLTGLRSESDSPEGSLEVLNESILFAGHPYANSPRGTIANLTKFKTPDLIAYHRSLVQTSRMLLVIVGDIEPAAFKEKAEAAFGKLQRGNFTAVKLPALAFSKPSVDITSKPVETNYVKGSFAAPSLGDPDYYAMRTAMTILQTQVFQEVRVRRNLSYAPDAELGEYLANSASISVSTTKPNEAISVMLGEMQKLRENTVEEDTIGQMAGYFLTTYYLKQETNAAQAAELGQYELLGGGWRNSLEFLDRIRRVKPSEIQAVANKYMKNVRFVVVGNPTDIDRSV
ncbi:MAG: pitrilysin family protein, partial [Pyrinomonadaceae bacterium]